MSNGTVRFAGRTMPEDEILRLAAIIDSSDDAIIGKSVDGIIQTWNAGATRMYGYTREEAVGQPISLVIPSDRQDEMNLILDRIRRGERLPSLETTRRRKDGTCLDVSVTVSPVFDVQGLLVGASSIARDITERKRAEAALRESEDRFETFMAQLHAIVFIKGHDGALLYANPMLKALFGWNDAVGRHTTDLLPPDMAESMLRDDRRVMASGPEVIHEQIVDVDGNERLFETRKFPFRNGRGEVLLGGIAIEETMRRRAEDALRESEDRFRLLLDSAAESIYGIDLDGNCTFCNDACVRVLGHASKAALLGRNMHWEIHHTRRDGNRFEVEDCGIYRAFRTGEQVHVEDEVLWRADGTSFAAEYWSHPQVRDGKVVGAVVTFFDITQRKRAEAEREKLVEDLRAALAQVRTLGGLIPICSSCKKIRDDRGYWNILEAYLSEHADVKFSHGICPDCEARLFAAYFRDPPLDTPPAT